MATYCWKCVNCGARAETNHIPAGAEEFRHMDDSEICGSMRRDYKAEAVGVSLENLRAARG